MKIHFNIGYNFQAAWFLGEFVPVTPNYTNVYRYILEHNRPYRKIENYPDKTMRECRKLFKNIKKL